MAGGATCYFRAIPPRDITSTLPMTLPAAASALPLPPVGTSAVAIDGLGVVDGRSADVPMSTASIAKVILALCVLEKAPLKPGQQGHVFTVAPVDVDQYVHDASLNGSTLPVTAGERLSEYQLIQALMIPSADNIAESLARWTFGSHRQFRAYATDWLVRHHLDHTVIGDDASGLDVDTRSTARDLAQLGLIAMNSPVLREIMGQSGAEFPEVGHRANYNSVLGQGGIAAGKTGNNRDNRGALLFMSTVTLRDRTVDVSAVILGQPDLATALAAAPPVMEAVRHGVRLETIVPAGQFVGESRSAWGASSPVVALLPLSLIRWARTPVILTLTESTLTASAGRESASVPVATPLDPGPSRWWRLSRDWPTHRR